MRLGAVIRPYISSLMSSLDSILLMGDRFELFDEALNGLDQGDVRVGVGPGAVDADACFLDAGEHGHELEDFGCVLLGHGLVDVDAEHLGFVGEADAVGGAGEDADAVVVEGVAVEVVLGFAGAGLWGGGCGDGLGLLDGDVRII